MIIGGGTDVDAGFKWMIDKSGGGHFVIIRTDESWGYNDYIYNMGNITSVSTFVIASREGANARFVSDRVYGASALFIAGGDQFTYVTNWNNTEVQKGLLSLLKRGVPMGGTSAGMMVLSQYIYTCDTGDSTVSSEVRSSGAVLGSACTRCQRSVSRDLPCPHRR
jgi:cyanophycinase